MERGLPMDGVGAAIKSVVKDTIAFNPNGVIRNTAQLMDYLPSMSVDISTYNDVNKFSSLYPTPLRNLQLISRGFGGGSVHEVFFSKEDDKEVR